MNKSCPFVLLIVLAGSNCFSQEKGDSSVSAVQLTVSISPTYQFLTDKNDKIVGKAFSMEFPALTVYHNRLMLSLTAIYGSGSSTIDITAKNANFTTQGGYLNFFQYKVLFGFSVLKTESFRITPYAGIMFAELIGEKNLRNQDPDYNSLRLFPNYTLGATVEYNLTAKDTTNGYGRLRHYLRLNIAYNFLDPSTTSQGHDNFGLPQRSKDIGLGWGVFLTE